MVSRSDIQGFPRTGQARMLVLKSKVKIIIETYLIKHVIPKNEGERELGNLSLLFS